MIFLTDYCKQLLCGHRERERERELRLAEKVAASVKSVQLQSIANCLRTADNSDHHMGSSDNDGTDSKTYLTMDQANRAKKKRERLEEEREREGEKKI